MRMVGVPEQSFLKFAQIFLANGYRIARAEQVTEVSIFFFHKRHSKFFNLKKKQIVV